MRDCGGGGGGDGGTAPGVGQYWPDAAAGSVSALSASKE